MKLLTLTLPAIMGMLCTMTFFSTCKSSKKISKKDLTFIITLKKKQESSYLEKEYSNYNPTNIKKSNLTLNQYRVHFSVTEKEEKRLVEQLKNDTKVVEFSISTNSGIKIQSSKNEKSSKVSPVKKN